MLMLALLAKWPTKHCIPLTGRCWSSYRNSPLSYKVIIMFMIITKFMVLTKPIFYQIKYISS